MLSERDDRRAQGIKVLGELVALPHQRVPFLDRRVDLGELAQATVETEALGVEREGVCAQICQCVIRSLVDADGHGTIVTGRRKTVNGSPCG